MKTTKRNPHSKASFQNDFRYIRNVMRECESLMKQERWNDFAEIWSEIVGVVGTLEIKASENANGETFIDSWDRETLALKQEN